MIIKKINYNIYYIKINKIFYQNKQYFINKFCNYYDLSYINKFFYNKDKDIHLCSIILQKFICGKFFNLKYKNMIIKRNKYGKPFILNCNLNYNISHDENIIIGIFNLKFKIGIDILSFNKINKINNLNIFKENECENKFITFCILEAYFKALGYGLTNLKNRKIIIDYKNKIIKNSKYKSKINIFKINNFLCCYVIIFN